MLSSACKRKNPSNLSTPEKCRRIQQIRLLLIAFGNFLYASNLKFCNCYSVISDNSTED